MVAYIEVSILVTFTVLYLVSVVVSPSKSLIINGYRLLICSICSSLAVLSDYSIIFILLVCLAFNRNCYQKLIISMVLYIMCIQCMTLLFPCQIMDGVLYIPVRISGSAVILCVICNLLIWFYLYLYNPAIYMFRYVTIQFSDYILCGWGYVDSGNLFCIDGKPVIFMKAYREFEDVFCKGNTCSVQGIHGVSECVYLPCTVRKSFTKYTDAYIVCKDFDGKFDFILNLYS